MFPKHRFIFAALFCVWITAVRADPTADLEAAIRALLAQPTFAWRVTLESNWPTPTVSVATFEGVTERAGYSVVRTSHEDLFHFPGSSERPVRIVYLADRCVLQIDEPWITPFEWAASRSGMQAILPAVDVARSAWEASHPGGTTYFKQGYVGLPRPDLILGILLGAFEQATEAKQAIDGTVKVKLIAFISEPGTAKIEVPPGALTRLAH
jgi:hypothetical protein